MRPSSASVGSRRPSAVTPGPDAASPSRRQSGGDRGNGGNGGNAVQQLSPLARWPSDSGPNYVVPDSYLSLPEIEGVPTIQDRNELSRLDSRSIEELASRLRSEEELSHRRGSFAERRQRERVPSIIQPPETEARAALSKSLTEFYTISYLILFAALGTLARLGLQALAFFPGAPVSFSSVWPNFAGSLVIGFLTEDRMLFRYERGSTSTYTRQQQIARVNKDEESSSPGSEQDLATAKQTHLAVKKTIPLYIGLATGLCGSFTSFSAFVRDIFLALSNDLPMPDGAATPRNGGYSFLALLAIILGTLSLSFAGFYLGGHLADALESVTPSLRYPFSRRVIDPLAVVLGWGSWIGAVVLSIVPPDRYSNPGASEFWRGRATFALVFAPLGCLARFYASTHLNGRFAAFPLGTFVVNVLGTAILGLAWDLAHVPEGGVAGCQVLQGIEDGFCGCLTTVSTWVVELAVLGRRKAYVYGGTSIFSSLILMVAIMGGLRWSDGFADLLCLH
ncbi:CrcB-like protein-domain-containing protein [Nemania sp. FL0031]|nr:CrcB-like protein-domain-containing protein [Nemania sp. FL0031]